MNYLFAPSSEPIEYDECGQLYSHDTFIHIKRSMDVFVLILLCNGTLFIAQNQNLYELHPNQYVILFPGQEHYGYLPSTPGLSYYWCHFRFKNNEYEIIRNRLPNPLFIKIQTSPLQILQVIFCPKQGQCTMRINRVLFSVCLWIYPSRTIFQNIRGTML